MRCCSAERSRWTSGRAAWALVSLTGIAVSCLGAILLPYFDILAAIMGALGNLVAAYALPALFTLVSLLLLTSSLTHWHYGQPCKCLCPLGSKATLMSNQDC